MDCNTALAATTHHLLNQKWLAGPRNRSNPRLLDPFPSLHKFFDLLIPSIKTFTLVNARGGGAGGLRLSLGFDN